MCDYKLQQHLFRHFKVKNTPKSHWSEMSRWKMIEVLIEVYVAIVVKWNLKKVVIILYLVLGNVDNYKL